MYNRLKHYWYNASIRKKLMFFIMTVIFSVSLFSIYLLVTTYSYIHDLNSSVNEYFKINMLQYNNTNNNKLIAKYFHDSRLDSLADYNQSVDDFYIALQEIKVKPHSLAVDDLIRTINNSFALYCNESNSAIRKQRENNGDFQIHQYNGIQLNQQMDTYLAQLLALSLREGNTVYSRLVADARFIMTISSLLMMWFLLSCLLFGLTLANYLTKPIEQLAELSTQMSQGNLDVKEMEITAHDEVGVLAKAFNTMSSSIRKLVNDLQEKSLIEKRLHGEELKNIKNLELLKEARFLALQSQINPHFLFNTLNTVSRVITLGRSEEAIKLINAISGILRYNMGNSKLYVTLTDELDIVKKYIHIQQSRFGDRLQVDIDCSKMVASSVIIPCFTLQPIVENSVIHGLEPKVTGGRLKIKVYRDQDQGNVVIKIIDNGIGINKMNIKNILGMKTEESSGRRNSIGLSNVMNRLAIFTGKTDCFEMKSKVGLGTIVIIKIPIKR